MPLHTNKTLRRRLRRLRVSARTLAQATIAAPVAWLVVHYVFGQPQPIFAPISALVVVGATVGYSYRRAIELVIGIAIGVAIADVFTLFVGHGVIQMGTIVLLAMAITILLGGGPMAVTQAAIAAVLVAAVPTQDGLASFNRFIASGTGGLIAVVMTIFVLPVRPTKLAQRSALPVLQELEATFRQIALGLRSADEVVAKAAIIRARATGDYWAQLNEAVGIGRRASKMAPVRRREQGVIVDLSESVRQLDYAIRDARIIARVAWRLVETGYDSGARLELSMSAFADAVRELRGHFELSYDATLATREAALRATRLAASAPAADDELVFKHMVGQIRSTTVDFLRATGLSRSDAITMMLGAVAEGRAGTTHEP